MLELSNNEVEGYYDNVGGFHASGIGYAPDKTYCGECDRSTCIVCPIWAWKKRKELYKDTKISTKHH